MDLVKDKVYEFLDFYDWALSVADDRVKDWFLMESYTPTIVLTIIYLLTVWLGPKLMENREPFQLKTPLFLYNVLLVVINFHICSQLLSATWKLNYSYTCQPVSYTEDPDEIRVAKALWWFYFSKLVEMFDTIFFVLRKKNNQISFLHVYHHATMFPIWWIGVKWVAGGQSFFGAMINSFIHVVMYSYYGLSALGPGIQKYLWWKQYLTMLQLLQFYIGMIYGVQGLLLECDYPKWMQWAGLIYGLTIIALFLNFYIQAYLKPKQDSKIQFVTGMTHSLLALWTRCNFPEWMHWALIFYAFSILLLFLNFYFHAYVKAKQRKTKSGSKGNGKLFDGHVTNGDVAVNGNIASRKEK